MQPDIIKSHLKEEFENLKESSLILQTLINHTSYGLVLLTSDYHIIGCNRKMREWFPHIKGNSSTLCYKSFHGSDSPCAECHASDSEKKIKKQSDCFVFKNGPSQNSYKITCTPIEKTKSNTAGYLVLVEDVTRSIKNKQKLPALETQHKEIIENAGDAILTFDSNWQILRTNHRAKELFGYADKEFSKLNLFSLLPEDTRLKQEKVVKQIFTKGRNTDINRILQGKCIKNDGTVFPIAMTFALQNTGDMPTATFIIRDISERKNYEQQLEAQTEKLEKRIAARTKQLALSEERYRSLVETANDAIISTDRKGKIIYCNKKAEEIYGYSQEEIISANISRIAPEQIWEEALHLLKNDITHGKTVEGYGIKKDNTIFPVEFTISAFKKGTQTSLTLIARDITERKKLAEELRVYTAKLEEKVKERTYELTASQQTLKEKVAELSIQKEISEALSGTMDLEAVLNIILVGVTSHYGLGFNRAFLFLLNSADSCLEGKVAIGPADSVEAQKIWSAILGKNLTLKEILQSYINKTGKIDTHVTDLIKNIKIPVSNTDNIMIQVVNNKTSFNIKQAFTNPLISKDLITIMNCNAFALVPLIAHDNALGVLWADNAITKSPINDFDMERLRSFAINASLAIDQSHLYEGIQAKVAELDTANKTLQENKNLLIRSEKLAAVGEMSATVAHGIRNPLVAIGGFARRMLKKKDPIDRWEKYLSIIVTEIDRLENILTELLDFVRTKKLSLKKIKPHKIVEQALEVIFFELEKHNIKVEKTFQHDLPPIQIDSGLFKRVLHNIFNNAIDAMPEGGVLRITLKSDKSKIIVSIADTGTGISDKNAEKVFHPFFTDKPTGTGLGLSVCNQIISMHGGHILLKSNKHAGATFDICLPLPPK